MKKVWSALLVGLCFSCTNQSDPAVSIDEDGCIVLNLDEAMKHKSNLKWSDMVTSIEYIPLETSDSCLLRSDIILDMTDDYILIDDLGNTPALFDRRGKFLRRIGRIGRGPGEMQTVVKRGHIDPETNEITLFLYGLHVMHFDIQGKFLGEDRLSPMRFYTPGEPYRSPHLPLHSHIGNENKTFYFHFNADSTRVFTSKTFDREATFERVPGMYGVTYTSRPSPHYLGYNNIHYDTNYFPSLCKFKDYIGYYDGRQGEDRHDRYYRFYYDGRIDNPYRIVYEHSNLEKDFSIHIFKDLKKYLYISGRKNDQGETFWYDVEARRLHYMPTNFPNDLDGGYPLGLFEITPDGKQLYYIHSVSILRKWIASVPNTRLEALLDSLPEDANGILIYATLK